MTRLLLNKAHYPVTTLGPGTRAGIWTQGCTLACEGCLSRDTWPADPATAMEVEALLGWLGSLPDPLDGVTISGGEPLEQPEALRVLLAGIHQWRRERSQDIDILVYTGYSPRWVLAHPESVQYCDAVIAGRYVDRLNTGTRWRGSDNQRILMQTALGHRRYATVDTTTEEQTFQISLDGDHIWCIGIPRRGDLDVVTERLAAAGIGLGEASWRP